jgi:hypothetical protein
LLVSINVVGQNIERLRFIQNKGQWSKEIDFQAQVSGGRVGVSSRGFSILLLDMEALEHRHLAGHESINEATGRPSDEGVSGHYFKINLLGSNPDSKPEVANQLDGHYNYFLGNDTCQWASHALAFATIIYPEVYAGIDFRVSSVGNNLKYDFIVKPGANPEQIKIEYEGVDGIENQNDDLEIRTTVGVLNEQKPYTYQLINQDRQTVASRYRLHDNVVSFTFPDNYDECRELVIDPLLIFSTYSGSTADNWGSTATPGEHGALYSAGVTNQDSGGAFPATVGAFQTFNRGSFDMAVIKYDSAGTRFLYATHLGGLNNDSPESLVVDKTTGDLLVLGISSSPDYPTSANAYDKTFNGGTTIFNRVLNTEDQWDIVVTRLSSDGGTLVGSTFLGGSGNDGLNLPKQSGGPLVVNYGDEMRGDIITDDAGNVYLSSVTASSDFPVVGGFDNTFNGGNTDGLVVKMAPDLSSIIWSSYLGGSGFDAAYSIQFDHDNNIVLAGGTTSANFPATAGSYQPAFKGIVDGWIARVAADGSAIVNATFTGTNSFDQVYFIDLDSNGDIFCYGQTAGHMPITSGVYRNANSGQFLQKFSSDLTTLGFSTVFGSSSNNGLVTPNISPTAFLVNDCNNIYMAGWGGFVNSSPQTGFWQSTTNGMPVTSDAFQKTTSGSDFYFMVLNGDATTLVYATYLGGSSSKTHVDGGTSRFDKYGIVYHAVCSGCSFGNESGGSSSDFPTTPNAHSRFNRSFNCNNAAFKFDLTSLRANFETNNTALTMPGFNNVCYPDSIVFENHSTGGKTITWDFDDGTVLVQNDTDPRFVIHQYKQAGQYHVKLKIADLSTCSQTDSITKVVYYFKPNITVGDDAKVCEGNGFRLTASGGVSYHWSTQDGTFSSDQQSPTVWPAKATSYFVTVKDSNGCTLKDTLNVDVTQNVHAHLQTYDLKNGTPGYNNVCYPDAIQFKNLSINGVEYVWDFGDGTIPFTVKDSIPVVHAFPKQGVYQVRLKALNPNTCNLEDLAIKTINYFQDHIVVGEDGEICEGSTFQLRAQGGNNYQWTTEDRVVISTLSSPVVKPVQSTRYFVTVTDANKCVRKDTVQVVVLDSVDAKWLHELKGSCFDRPSVYVQNISSPADDVTYRFDFGDGTGTDENEAEHLYEKDGVYSLRFVAQKKFCAFEETVQVPVYTLVVPNVFTPEGSPGLNDEFTIGFGENLLTAEEAGQKIQLTVVNRWGVSVYGSDDYKNDWDGRGLEGGVYYINIKVGALASCKGWVHIVK